MSSEKTDELKGEVSNKTNNEQNYRGIGYETIPKLPSVSVELVVNILIPPATHFLKEEAPE